MFPGSERLSFTSIGVRLADEGSGGLVDAAQAALRISDDLVKDLEKRESMVY